MNEAEGNRGVIKHAKTGGMKHPHNCAHQKKPGLLRNGGKGSVGPDKTPFGCGWGVAAGAEPTAPVAPLTTTQSPGRGGHSLGGPLRGARASAHRHGGGGMVPWNLASTQTPIPPPDWVWVRIQIERLLGNRGRQLRTLGGNHGFEQLRKNARGRPLATPPPSINRTSVRFLEPLSFAESRGWCLSGPGRSLDPVRLLRRL